MKIEADDKQSDHIPEKAKKAVILDKKNLMSLRNDLTPSILNRLCRDFNLDMHFLLSQMLYLQKVIDKDAKNLDSNAQDEEFQSFIETYFDIYAPLFERLIYAKEGVQDDKIVIDVDRIRRTLEVKFKTPVNKTTQSLKQSLTKIVNAIKSNGVQLTEIDRGCLDRLHDLAEKDLDDDCSWFFKFIEGFPEVVNGDMSLQEVLSIARTRFHLLDEAFHKDFVKSWRDQLYYEAQFFLSIQLFLNGKIDSIDSYVDQYGALYEELCKEKTTSAPIAYLQKIHRDQYDKTGTLDN